MKKYKMTLMFDDLDKAMGTFCFSRPCGTCPLMRGNNGSDDECSRLRVENPGKAAELMGLEVVEVEDKPRLTEAELAICKAVGAKWVSINDDGGNVDLWDEEPCKGSSDYFIGYPPSPFGLARIASGLFPSLNPGDCVKIGKETAKNELLQTAQKISVIISSLSFVWRKKYFSFRRAMKKKINARGAAVKSTTKDGDSVRTTAATYSPDVPCGSEVGMRTP